jgi:hypothetical protein
MISQHSDQDGRLSAYSAFLLELCDVKEALLSDKIINLKKIIADLGLREPFIDHRLSIIENYIDKSVPDPNQDPTHVKDVDSLLRLTSRLIDTKKTTRPSDDDLMLRVQHLLFASTGFKAAVGIAILGSVLIGLVSLSSTWINFTASNVIAKTQEDLAKTQTELTKTQRDSIETEHQYANLQTKVNDIGRKLDTVIADANANISAKVGEFNGKIANYTDEVQKKDKDAEKVAEDAKHSIPDIVRSIVLAKQDELNSILSSEERTAIQTFKSSVTDITNKYTADLQQHLDTDKTEVLSNKQDTKQGPNSGPGWVNSSTSSVVNFFKNLL